MDAPAFHAEPVDYDPTAMRWVFASGLPACGRLVGAPGELGEMLAPGGLIVKAVAERRALWTWLAEPNWPADGVAVRQAVYAAAGRLDEWLIVPGDDEVSVMIAHDVIDRTLKQFIASHGGEIALVRADHDEVEVQLKGACARCAAAELTMHGRIEHEIRERTGSQVKVSSVRRPSRRPVGRRQAL